jgi:hypothetical protein
MLQRGFSKKKLNSIALGLCRGGQLARNELLYYTAEHTLRSFDREVIKYKTRSS